MASRIYRYFTASFANAITSVVHVSAVRCVQEGENAIAEIANVSMDGTVKIARAKIAPRTVLPDQMRLVRDTGRAFVINACAIHEEDIRENIATDVL